MLHLLRKPSPPPTMDLDTVRDTLSYMQEDMSRVAGLERVAAALEVALQEIEAIERGRAPGSPGASRPVAEAAPYAAHFIPVRW